MDQTNETRLGSAPLGKLLFQLGLPGVAAQVINVLYNIVDRIYIGNIPGIGDMALTGVGVTLPVIMVIAAFSAFVGMGGAPLASIRLGARDHEGAERILGSCIVSLLSLSVILMAVFFAFQRPLLFAFGASENVIGYAQDYLTIYLFGTLFVQLALGLNTFISAQGKAKTAMLSVLIGAVLNIVLDPLFIFVFHMGVRGAALATILSQAVSAAWVISFLLGKRTVIPVRKKYLRFDWRIIGQVMGLGISPFIMQATESLVTITLNSGLQAYGGDLYVGSMTILTSVLQLIVMPINGFTQGVQPIMSYCYGAGDHARVRQTYHRLLTVTLSFSAVACLLAILLAHPLARLFSPNQALIDLTARMMPVFLGGIWIFGAQLACQSTFLALGQAKISLFLALLRKVILLVPLALVLPRFFGVTGIYFSEPIADFVASCTTLVIFLTRYRKLLPLPKKALEEAN
ncbi:MAG: MATE family efflux transporter [Acutalibacteraceae bacterium]